MEVWMFIVAVAIRALKLLIHVLTQQVDFLISYFAKLAARHEMRKAQGARTNKHVDKSGMDKLIAQIFTSPLILTEIFRNSDMGRVKKFRLVCKAWNEEICSSIGKKDWVISLIDKNRLPLFMELIEGRNKSRFPVPFAEINLMGQDPLTREHHQWLNSIDFTITGLCLAGVQRQRRNPLGMTYESADSLLRTYSATLTKLCVYYSASTVSPEALCLPQLEELSLHYYDDPPDQLAQCTSLFLGIISAAPKLRILSISGPSLAAEILKRADLSSLKQLEILGFVELEKSRDLGNVRQLLVWKNSWAVDGLGETKRVLSPFANSLKSLTIRSPPLIGAPSGVNPSTFPIFPHLVTLELQDYNPLGLDFGCFPSLKHFKCTNVVVERASNNITTLPSRSRSVRTVSVRGRVSTFVDQTTFPLDLRSNFRKAHTWELPFAVAVSFCRVVLGSSVKVKTLILRLSERRFGCDEQKFLYDDMYVFSYLERLKDLETLGLFSDCKKPEAGINLQALKFQKMPKLKTLMIRFSPNTKLEDIPSFKDCPKVIIFGLQKLRGNEEILLQENVEIDPHHGPIYNQ